jgi:hypothetical protein
MWASEHTSVVELVGAEDVIAKIVYTLSNPVKDHLVERTQEWPGASSLEATLDGRALVARRPVRFFRADGLMPAQVQIECKMPRILDRISSEEYEERIRAGIKNVELLASAERSRTGRKVLGRQAVLAQSPFDRPNSREPRRKLDPHVASIDKGPRMEAIQRRKGFMALYSNARQRWLAGEDVAFPFGTWWLARHASVTVCAPESS